MLELSFSLQQPILISRARAWLIASMLCLSPLPVLAEGEAEGDFIPFTADLFAPEPQVPDDGQAHHVATLEDWSVFMTANPRECFATSVAQEETGWPQGPRAEGEAGARLLLTYRDSFAENDPGELALYTNGRAIVAGTSQNVLTSAGQFPLFNDGDWAWPPSREGDAQAIATFRASESAEITLYAEGYTPVRLVFSLKGFEEAMTRAQLECGLIPPEA